MPFGATNQQSAYFIVQNPIKSNALTPNILPTHFCTKVCAFLASIDYQACGLVTNYSLIDHDMDTVVDWSDSIYIWGKFWFVLRRKNCYDPSVPHGLSISLTMCL